MKIFFFFFNERYESNEFNIKFEEVNVNLSREEILKSIHQLKTDKSGGPNRLINDFLSTENLYFSQLKVTSLIKSLKFDIFRKDGQRAK